MLELSKELSLCIHGGDNAPLGALVGSVIGGTLGMAATLPYFAIIGSFRSFSSADLLDLFIFAGTPTVIGTTVGLVLDTFN